jgi:hypothetical protein
MHPLWRYRTAGKLIVFCLTRASIVAALVAVLSLAGCGGKKEEGNGRPVTGKITYNGQPIAEATVTFVGDFNSAFAQTDAEGNFKLKTALGDKVPLGDYQVTVIKTETLPTPPPVPPEEYKPPDPNAPPPPEPKDLLPPKYKQPDSSQLTASVTESGENHFEFDLKD